FLPALVWFFLVYPFRPLPRLAPAPRTATVTRLHTATVPRDPDGPVGPPVPHHLLVEFALEGAPGADAERVLLADVIAQQDVNRFAPGTRWQVRVFLKRRGRAVLAADHDDVVRVGHDLETVRRGVG